ncbi:hypothetical protein FEM48_Zijuj10G0012000 [Ziziphus jujuba var. spinosa]|uniref:Phorbol-ester/DAG-type domain-containing protein n=1 Tax=Ziziphus jujuba var. spinosa TaxID=714518 RepID=A0A978UKE7_ZIZJJ|nr:hypothetical protein FEM48_Zijuj10G0012000 [Ziziphus jujuba var. spinosa]
MFFVLLILIGASCAVCNASCIFSGKVYRCVDCNFNVHKACLSLPLNVDYEDHVHPFTLVTSLNEDEDGKYYCGLYEEKRKQNRGLLMLCRRWAIIHFECVLPPDEAETPILALTADEKQLVSKLDMKIEKMEEMLKQLLHERHRENVTEKLDKVQKSNAEAEELKVGSIRLTYRMHRLSVGRREQDINHPSHHHPLREWDLGTDINRLEMICRGCNRDSADVYCPEEGFAFSFFGYAKKYACRACGLEIGYNELVLKCGGFNCMCYLHVQCFRVPKEMKHPLHPQHTLALLEGPPPAKVVNPSIILRNIRSDISSTSFHCNACRSIIRENVVLHCNQCPEFILDISCAYINPNLKCDRHDHHLAYFDFYRGFHDGCAVCNALCSATGKLYRCVDCNFNVHKACLSLPLNVDYEDHVHPFTLITSLNEDEDGKYYCDLCEERREPNHGLYCCVECGPLFVAHFECVLPPGKAETPTLALTANEKQLVSNLNIKIKKMGKMLKQLLDERHRENVTEKLDKLEKSNAEAEVC